MSLFFKAHGTPSVGLFLIRLIVGIYTLSLGIMQASNMELYIAKVKALQILSENNAFIVGFILPFILIIFGSLYIMGFFTPTTSFILALITLIKIVIRGLFPTEGIPFNKDLIFLACFLTTLFAGAGVISFDVFLDRRKKKVKADETKTAAITAEVITEQPIEPKAEEKQSA
ncbi:MAG: hypothetical protein L0Y79_09915 [Chlorobi bacterium]|nr:hypothetical protein [Chlorobiota bacterium]MCI0716824.1 hypothetical protein [Chlorobiota bacterium]